VDFKKDGSYTVVCRKLTIKDVTKDIKGTAVIVIKGGKVTATTALKIKLPITTLPYGNCGVMLKKCRPDDGLRA
jgi:hypothetical protein